MIFSRLVISNFKNYCGANEFDFSRKDDRNVVIIGGMNGSGKTTFVESIRLCLYGNKIFGQEMSDSKYRQYISECWHRGSKKDTTKMFIELDIDINEVTKSEKFTVKREFVKRDDEFVERIYLYKNNKLIELIDENYWDYFVEQIIPPQVSRYFFFDGETVRNIIASEDSQDYLTSALHDLTGIKELKTLSDDLVEVKHRISRTNMKPSVVKKISLLSEQISKLESQKCSLDSEITELLNYLQKLEDEKRSIDDNLKRTIGVREKQIRDLTELLDKKKTQRSKIIDQINDFSNNELPIIISKDVINEALLAAKNENDKNSMAQSSEMIINTFIGIKNKIKALEMSPKTMKQVIWEIDSKLADLNDLKSKYLEPVVDLTYAQIANLEATIEKNISTKDFVKLLSEREELSIDVKNIERDLSRYVDQSLIPHHYKISLITSRIEEIKKIVQDKQAISDNKIKEIQIITSEIGGIERSMLLDIRDKEAVKVINDLIRAIDLRVSLQESNGICTLEDKINEIYFLLKNKEDMVKQVTVQSDFSLCMRGYDDKEIFVSSISEGEKSILMYSIVYALVNFTESRLPLIIDSPLGRMDSKHVENLNKYLYSSMGEQVIILSHDREITKENIGILEPSTYKKYTLSDKIPKIREGYFE